MPHHIRVKNVRLSLVNIEVPGRTINLHRGKEADVDVVVDENGTIQAPLSLLDKIDRREIEVLEFNGCKLPTIEEEAEAATEAKTVEKPKEKKPLFGKSPKPAEAATEAKTVEKPVVEHKNSPLSTLGVEAENPKK